MSFDNGQFDQGGAAVPDQRGRAKRYVMRSPLLAILGALIFAVFLANFFMGFLPREPVWLEALDDLTLLVAAIGGAMFFRGVFPRSF